MRTSGYAFFNDFIRDKLSLKQGDEMELQIIGNGRHACDKCLKALSKSIDK